jgi:hypothetical protein
MEVPIHLAAGGLPSAPGKTFTKVAKPHFRRQDASVRVAAGTQVGGSQTCFEKFRNGPNQGKSQTNGVSRTEGFFLITASHEEVLSPLVDRPRRIAPRFRVYRAHQWQTGHSPVLRVPAALPHTTGFKIFPYCAAVAGPRLTRFCEVARSSSPIPPASRSSPPFA